MNAKSLEHEEVEQMLGDCCGHILRLWRKQPNEISLYLASEPFRTLQTKGLGLYSGLYAFYDILSEPGPPKLIYCVRDPFNDQVGSVEFPFYSCSETTWQPDPETDFKQFIARVVREREAETGEGLADFYTILNTQPERLTPFEKDIDALYAPDAEFSTFILGCILRMIPGCLVRFSDRSPWTAPLPIDSTELQFIQEQATSKFPDKTKLLPEKTTLEGIFELLGLLENKNFTERFWLLVSYLADAIRRPQIYNQLFGNDWLDVGDKQRRLAQLKALADSEQAGRNPETFPEFDLVRPLLEILLSSGKGAKEFGSASRIGFENLFAHLVWRRSSSLSRSWLVIPLYRYFSSIKQQHAYVAFFLGTFKDTDNEGHQLSDESLRLRIDNIRECAFAACKDFENVFLNRVVEPKIEALDQKIETEKKIFKIVGTSQAIVRLGDEISKAARTKGNVLITGERGTGKRLVARQIHLQSERASAPYEEVNCPGFNDELLPSQLFGMKGGTATGVVQREGYFERAGNGVLLLDEVGDLSLKGQAAILKAIEEKEFRREGGTDEGPIELKARILAATNKNLDEAIEDGRFRGDLYDRLNVRRIHVPPLRDHIEDIPVLVDHFIARGNKKHNKRVKTISDDALKSLYAYHWPGNVRELENVLNTIIEDIENTTIELEDLPEKFHTIENSTYPATRTSRKTSWQDIEHRLKAIDGSTGPKFPDSRRFGSTPALSDTEIRPLLCDICHLADGYIKAMVDGLVFSNGRTSEYLLKKWFEKVGMTITNQQLPCRKDPKVCINHSNTAS